MNNRTSSLWIPAIASLIAAPGLIMILQKLAVQPRVLWIGDRRWSSICRGSSCCRFSAPSELSWRSAPLAP